MLRAGSQPAGAHAGSWGTPTFRPTLIYVHVTPLEGLLNQYARAVSFSTSGRSRCIPHEPFAPGSSPASLGPSLRKRAVDSLGAALAPVESSVRQYRATSRNFLLYLGCADHPEIIIHLDQLRRDPHILVGLDDQDALPESLPSRRSLISSGSLCSCRRHSGGTGLRTSEHLPELAPDAPSSETFPALLDVYPARAHHWSRINSSSKNCSAATISPPMSSCCSDTLACALVKQPTFPSIASTPPARINGPFTCHSAS